jgi:hypothetical protein
VNHAIEIDRFPSEVLVCSPQPHVPGVKRRRGASIPYDSRILTEVERHKCCMNVWREHQESLANERAVQRVANPVELGWDALDRPRIDVEDAYEWASIGVAEQPGASVRRLELLAIHVRTLRGLASS